MKERAIVRAADELAASAERAWQKARALYLERQPDAEAWECWAEFESLYDSLMNYREFR